MPTPTLNFVSGIATPPVNQLLHAVAARTDLCLRIWYATETDSKLYPWQTNPTSGDLRKALAKPTASEVGASWFA
jgi:hypothetical protein